MQVKRNDSILEVIIERNFNLAAIRELQQHINENNVGLIIDMKHSFFLDSEAIIFMHRWMKDGKDLKLRYPPLILNEILEVLGLSKQWDLKKIIEINRMPHE